MWKTKSVFKKNIFTFANDDIFYVYSSFLLADDEIEKLKNGVGTRFLMRGILSCNYREENALMYSNLDVNEFGTIGRVLLKIKVDKSGLTSISNSFH